ncbi:MAG TPA: thioesterase [Spirochaetota bacterium]|nr:thioesterase [Spirochaetota bacterium]HQP47942.1 thioesterase [Spirochaetota bacterium]
MNTVQHRVYREKFDVKFYEAGIRGTATMRALCNYLQAAANNHSRLLGTSMSDFSDQNMTWVYSRFHVRVDRYPACYENISVETWRSQSSEAFAFREYCVYDEQDAVIASGTARLVLIDVASRKPVPIPATITEQFIPEKGRALEYDFPSIRKPREYAQKMDFRVRMSDIDINNHANNSSYVDWITECVPPEVLTGRMLRSIELDYRAEIRYGEMITSASAHEEEGADAVFLHSLTSTGSDRPCTLARTTWALQ